MARSIELYNADVMAGRPPLTEAPRFGQRLAALRKNRGLTQKQFAEAVGITIKMVDYYERRAANPSLEFLQQASQVLRVSVGELVGSLPDSARKHRGPASRLEQRIDQIRRLPQKDREFILSLIDTVLERARSPR